MCHSNQSYRAVLFCSAICHAVKGVNDILISGYNPAVAMEMKAIEKHFPVVLFIVLYKVVLTFESVDEILKCDHSNESY